MKNADGLRRVPRHPRLILGLLLLSQVAVAMVWWRHGWQWGLALMVATHLAVVWATLYPRASWLVPALSRLPTAAREVWLTIDDGPSADTLAMLDLLDRHQARATFFVVGERALAQPRLIEAILQRGHDIGNHSRHHRDKLFWCLGPRALEREIGGNQQLLQQLSGRAPVWFRSVVGMTNPFVGLPLARHGLTRVAWSARGFDGVDCQPQQVIERITGAIAPGAIVLLHEGARHGHNPQILQGVLQYLQREGYRTCLPKA
ncbi:polysaccharide deacetylase family protein [Pseudoxanthomonas dokdonensis]|uniref:Acetyl xylan esterase n=1 Tax=Pseudoxanthomonas dokdonensis TaxID=344882 RepID=A0A0R0CN62_9GAMM|nr:polysaccharide deacetylase family protein [Pseudoxanthomonas dokdonensis]KRG67562.1 acetyl xylan esterase [Pseudoxanthomonas dokdonensis]